MRFGNILLQPIDASANEQFVIMDESSGNEISFTREQALKMHEGLARLLFPGVSL